MAYRRAAVVCLVVLALALPFDSIRSVHGMALLFSAATAVSLFFLARRFLPAGWAVAASGQ